MGNRKPKVHGLYVNVPLRDYHLAYILAGLKLLEEKHLEKGNKGSVTFIRNLRSHIRRYFSELIKQTKVYRRYLDHNPLSEDPPVDEAPPPEPTVYKDPDY